MPKTDLINLIDKYEEGKLFGGMEIKIENGVIVHLKSWHSMKY